MIYIRILIYLIQIQKKLKAKHPFAIRNLPFDTSSRWPFMRANCWKLLLISQTCAVVSLLAVASLLPLLSKARSRTSSSCPNKVAKQEFILASHTFAVLSIEDDAINEQSKLQRQLDNSSRWPINTLVRLRFLVKIFIKIPF